MHNIKICPECNTEYFAHIENCADCDTKLIHPEEVSKVLEEKKRVKDESLRDPVAVREGELNWMEELSNVLINSGIPSAVRADTSCNKGCCGSTCQLIVSSANAPKAVARIDEYYMELHPEIRASKELADEGKCPACGSPVSANATECPDCGLILVIVED